MKQVGDLTFFYREGRICEAKGNSRFPAGTTTRRLHFVVIPEGNLLLSLRYSTQRLNTSDPFVPPKPNEFESA